MVFNLLNVSRKYFEYSNVYYIMRFGYDCLFRDVDHSEATISTDQDHLDLDLDTDLDSASPF